MQTYISKHIYKSLCENLTCFVKNGLSKGTTLKLLFNGLFHCLFDVFFSLDPCSNANCNNGECQALLETQTKCNCDAGWEGDFCDSRMLSSSTLLSINVYNLYFILLTFFFNELVLLTLFSTNVYNFYVVLLTLFQINLHNPYVQ